MDEKKHSCANCGAIRFAGDMLFDQSSINFYCDDRCFTEWADSNFDVVTAYYRRFNIE